MKKHQGISYACQEENCTYSTKNYAMFLEHFHHGHLEDETIACTYCDRKFQMPTEMYAHRNKAHGPAPRNM